MQGIMPDPNVSGDVGRRMHPGDSAERALKEHMKRAIGTAFLALIAGAWAPLQQLDVAGADGKTRGELCTSSETDLPAHSTSPKATAGMPAPRVNARESAPQRARRLHDDALALYKATSKDAETFTAALLLPEVRRKVEAALRQKLTNEQCRKLAQQAQAEAIYWYQYMQDLERAEIGAGVPK
jgi:hypothetical protein